MVSSFPEWVRKAAAEETAAEKARWRERTQEHVERAATEAARSGQVSVTIDTGTFSTEADQRAAQQVVENLHLPPGYEAAVRVVDTTTTYSTSFGSQLSRTGAASHPDRKVQIHVERSDKQ